MKIWAVSTKNDVGYLSSVYFATEELATKHLQDKIRLERPRKDSIRFPYVESFDVNTTAPAGKRVWYASAPIPQTDHVEGNGRRVDIIQHVVWEHEHDWNDITEHPDVQKSGNWVYAKGTSRTKTLEALLERLTAEHARELAGSS